MMTTLAYLAERGFTHILIERQQSIDKTGITGVCGVMSRYSDHEDGSLSTGQVAFLLYVNDKLA